MVTRYKVKTRGGKVVSKKRVKSFGNSKKESKKQFDPKTQKLQIGISTRDGQVLQKAGVVNRKSSKRSQPILNAVQTRQLKDINPFKVKSSLLQRIETQKIYDQARKQNKLSIANVSRKKGLFISNRKKSNNFNSNIAFKSNLPKEQFTPDRVKKLNLPSSKTSNVFNKKKNLSLTPIDNSLLGKLSPTTGLNKLEKLRQAYIKDNQNAKASLVGLVSLPPAALVSGMDFLTGTISLIRNPAQVTEINRAQLNKAGANFGVRLAKGDPKALTDAAIMFAPVKAPNLKPIGKLPAKLKVKLNNYKYNKNIEIQVLNELKRKADLKKTAQDKANALEYKKLITKAKKEIEDINKGVLPQIKSSGEIARFEKLLTRKNKLSIKKLFQADIKSPLHSIKTPSLPRSVKDIRTLPADKVTLNKLFLFARRQGGESFSFLKKKLKKDFGWNVIQRGKGDKLRYDFLEPKSQRKKNVKTSRDKTYTMTEGGRIIDLSQRKGKVSKSVEPKLSKKDLKDLEFALGQELNTFQKEVVRVSKKNAFASNKKAQLILGQSVRKFSKRVNKEISTGIKRGREFNNRVNSFKSRFKDPIKTPKRKQEFLMKQKKLIKDKKKIQTDLIKLNKQLSILKSLTALLTKFKLDTKTLNVQIQKGLKDVTNANKLINDIVSPKKPNPIKPNKTGGKKGIKAPPRPKKLITPKPIKPLVPKLPKIPKRPVPKIPKIPKRILIGVPKALKKQGTRQAYLINIKKGGKIIKQTINGLPKVMASNLLRKILDTTPQTTGNLIAKGKTSIIDTQNKILSKKFRVKKTSEKKSLKVVEKKKFRKDNVGERKPIKKIIKKKTTKSTPTKKKSSQKPSKKVKPKSKRKKASTSKIKKKKK